MKTHMLVVIDESGSMGPQRLDVIGGFNQFLADQKQVPDDDGVMTLVKFNTNKATVYTAKPLADVPDLSVETYMPGGSTALLDAVAESLKIADNEPADRIVCVIVTDGQENASKETSLDQVAAMIKEREAKDNWTFVYLGVDPSKWSATFGINASNSQSYDPNTVRKDLIGIGGQTAQLRSSAMLSQKADYFSGDDEASSAAKALGSRGGKKGGPARAEALTPERRSEIARDASTARWANRAPSTDD